MKDMKIKLLLKWYDFYYAMAYPTYVFWYWLKTMKREPFLETMDESIQFFLGFPELQLQILTTKEILPL